MPYVLPRPPSFRDEIPGLTKDLLLLALTKGLSGLGKVPTGGLYSSPTGATASFSPAERVAGNPGMSAAQAVSQGAPPTATFNPTSYGFGNVPDYEQLMQRIKVQNAPLERQKLESDIKFQNAMPDVYKSMYGGGGTGLTQQLPQIHQEAEAGDEGAIQTLRYLRSKGLL